MSTSQASYRAQLRIPTPEETASRRAGTTAGYALLWMAPLTSWIVLLAVALR
jgi:hypothetical protein